MSRALPSLERVRGRDDLTIEDLVESADELLREVAPEQTRYKVQTRPDVRTIRYYTSQGLLPKPVSYTGGRARYSSEHLVRLLLIKRLQAEHLNLAAIKNAIEDKSEDQILDAIGIEPLEVAAGAAEAKPASSAPAPSMPRETSDLQRLELAPGGAIEISRAVLENPKLRAELANNLEALAQWLRATSTPEETP